jgi:hypothetical protein
MRYTAGGEDIDLRANMVEHNGFDGEVYWEAYYEQCADAPELRRLVSGAHAAMTLNIANSYLDIRALKESSTATVEAVLSGTRTQYVYERVGTKPERVENLLGLYLESLK